MRPVQPFWILLLLAVAAEPYAAEYAWSDMLACRDIAEDSRRLDCYDAALGRTSKTVDSTAREDRTQTLDDSPEVVQSPGDEVAVEAKDAATEADELQDVDEIIGVVTSVSQRARGGNLVILDNGQVWAEQFSSRYFPVKAGDTVTIKKRRFRGYRLVTQSGKGFSVERLR